MLDLILIVVVLLLIFGGSKLGEAGSDLGAAVKGLRRALRGKKPDAPTSPTAAPGVAADAEFPEVLAARQQASSKEAPRG